MTSFKREGDESKGDKKNLDQENEIYKAISYKKKNFTKRKKSFLKSPYKFGKLPTLAFFTIQQVYSRKSRSRPLIDIQIQENNFAIVL